jgi:hypothetical protein
LLFFALFFAFWGGGPYYWSATFTLYFVIFSFIF